MPGVQLCTSGFSHQLKDLGPQDITDLAGDIGRIIQANPWIRAEMRWKDGIWETPVTYKVWGQELEANTMLLREDPDTYYVLFNPGNRNPNPRRALLGALKRR